MEEKEKQPDEFFKCVKLPLKHVIKYTDINIPKIQETAIMANKIVIHTLQFMKLYLLNYYNKHNKLPVIDKTFINTCFKVQCEENKGLLLCKKNCGLWNRDENSARNIYKIANNAISKKERPTYFELP